MNSVNVEKLNKILATPVLVNGSSVVEASTDFGNLVTGNSYGLIQPRTIEELSSVIQFAKQYHLHLTPRGKGYTQRGQSVAQDNFTLDLTQLNQIYEVDSVSKSIACEAGAKWQDLVVKTVSQGMLPRVLPLNLEQTVGGLLSTGGIGSNSKTYGPVIANVLDLDVITGNGKHLKCNFTEESELYNVVLSGLGRCGVIASTTLLLRRFKPHIRTFHLLYDSLDSWMHDQVILGKDNQIEHVEGFCWTSAKGIRNQNGSRQYFAYWLYGLQVSVEFQEVAPEANDVLRDLHYWKLVHIEDEGTVNHVFRYQPRFEMMRLSGAWNQTHPWIDCFISVEALTKILPEILSILPLSLGDGHRTMMVLSDHLPELFMIPPEENILTFAILPVGVASNDTKTISALETVNQILLNAGGKRYLAGWLGSLPFNWEKHYGSYYDTWLQAKQKYDPENVFVNPLI